MAIAAKELHELARHATRKYFHNMASSRRRLKTLTLVNGLFYRKLKSTEILPLLVTSKPRRTIFKLI